MLLQALKLLRTSHNFSQKELAQKLQTSSSYLSEIESGKKIPSLAVLERYGQIFALPVSSILFLVENFECQPQNRETFVSLKILALLDFLAKRSHTN
jgi:transcriptional regulator with XRE-family HTH domain